MTRIIRVETCSDCPKRDHKGGFANVAYVPVCRGVKPSRELPYTVGQGFRSMVVAVATEEIPEWCPLEKLP